MSADIEGTLPVGVGGDEHGGVPGGNTVREVCMSTLEYEISVSGELPTTVLDEVGHFSVEVVPVRA